MNSVSEFIASRTNFWKRFLKSVKNEQSYRGLLHAFSIFSLFSRPDERAGSYRGRDGKGERSYASVHHDLECMWRNALALSHCDFSAHECGYCVMSAHHMSAASARGGTLWQKAHPIQTPLLIYVGLSPIAGYLLLDIKQQVPLPTKESVPDKMVTLRSASKLSLLRKTARFGWTVHSSVCFPQDVFSRQAWGVVHDPFNIQYNISEGTL